MFTRISRAELRGGASVEGTVLFQGGDHGSQVSFFLVDDAPGQGPRLHRHPYTETWIVQAGRALFVAGEEEVRPEPGEILVVGAGTPHKFVGLGPGRLRLVCIHASPRLIQEDLESDEERAAFAEAAMAADAAAAERGATVP
jgi:mannose-6-phosphate isomerase-like protein (cupin superfamily)